MDAAKRKELKNSYKARAVTGGVYYILCSGNGRRLLKSTVDMESSKRRFSFSLSTGGSPDPALRQEWVDYGIESFSFECIEELKKDEKQTDEEFSADIQALYEMWLEKFEQEGTKTISK